MEWIDCNAALGPLATDVGIEADEAALLAAMHRCDVAKALCYHRAAVEISFGYNSHLPQNSPLAPVWVLVPPATGEGPPLDELAAGLQSAGARGIRLYPRLHGFSLAPYAAGGLYTLAEQLGLPVFLAWDETDPDALYTLAGQYPKVAFVLTCVYYRNLRYLHPLMAARPNLYVETSFLKTFGVLEQLCRAFGAHRLLFGSGMPVYEYGPAMGLVLGADIAEEERALIASGALRRLLEGAGGL